MNAQAFLILASYVHPSQKTMAILLSWDLLKILLSYSYELQSWKEQLIMMIIHNPSRPFVLNPAWSISEELHGS